MGALRILDTLRCGKITSAIMLSDEEVDDEDEVLLFVDALSKCSCWLMVTFACDVDGKELDAISFECCCCWNACTAHHLNKCRAQALTTNCTDYRRGLFRLVVESNLHVKHSAYSIEEPLD